MPGVTTRNRLVNRASRGLWAWFSVCHATSIAITTVLPEPVAIFSAVRGNSALWTAFASSTRRRQSVPDRLRRPATSARKIAVSAASRWQNSTRSSPRPGSDQCCSSLRVIGVTLSYVRRHVSRARRTSLIRLFCSRRSPVTSKSRLSCAAAPRSLRDAGTGIHDSLGRRPALIAPVGPDGPISKYRSGAS